MKDRPLNIFIGKKGFTLIEMAIALVIVGLLVGMGAGLMGPLVMRTKFNETKEIVNAAVESVISYSASANKLPDIATFPGIIRTNSDSWKKALFYILDSNLTNSAVGGICGRKTTRISVDICPDTGCASPTTINNVAFIVLSGGGNLNNQTQGNLSITSATTINVYDTGLIVDDYSGGGDPARPEAYDDIVRWTTLNELRIKAGCTGSQLKILNNNLPSGKSGSAYSASVYADSGVPFPDGGDSGSEVDYEWCRQADPVKGSPGGISFSCNGSLVSSAVCSLTSGTWMQCTSLTLSGTPSGAGNYMLTFFARDENDSAGTDDNISEKSIVLTVDP